MMLYVSRSSWGAPAGDPAPSQPFTGPLETIWIHTGAVRLATIGDPNEERAHCRSYERTALQRGWSAVGYSALVGQSGTAYVGRGISRRSGANNGAHNDRALSVCVIGDGDSERLTDACQRTLTAVVDDLIRTHNASRVRLLGHREEPTNKSCPGAHPFAWVQANRDANRHYTGGVEVITDEDLERISRAVLTRHAWPYKDGEDDQNLQAQTSRIRRKLDTLEKRVNDLEQS